MTQSLIIITVHGNPNFFKCRLSTTAGITSKPKTEKNFFINHLPKNEYEIVDHLTTIRFVHAVVEAFEDKNCEAIYDFSQWISVFKQILPNIPVLQQQFLKFKSKAWITQSSLWSCICNHCASEWCRNKSKGGDTVCAVSFVPVLFFMSAAWKLLKI